MREQRHILRKFRRLGFPVTIQFGKESNLVRSLYKSVIKNNETTFTTYTPKSDINPGEKKLSIIGFSFETKIILVTPALSWINQGFDLTLLEKNVNHAKFEIGNRTFNLSQIKPFGSGKGKFMYVAIGGG